MDAALALRGIVGHTGTVRLLARLVERQRLPHALILDGPSGCGRRTLALALAAALLCPERRAGDACGVCQHCQQTAARTHPDLTVLPSSREAPRGIPLDEIRSTVEAAAASPLLGVGRVIVIPEAERLRDAAANATLKLIEEPPPGTTIVMTALAAAGVLPTIRSRAQVFRLSALTADEAARLPRPVVPAGGGLPPPPLPELARILAGLDFDAIATVAAALPSRLEGGEDDAEAPTAAAVQRACLRQWLIALGEQVRRGLRSPDPAAAAAAVAGLERIARAQGDLQRNHTPRLVLEALALGR